MKICIIGGGTAGWWCAAYMQKFLNAEITLIESDEIPTSGVGESSLPQIGTFFEELGIPEKEWMDGCNAVHKYGNMKYEWDGVGKDPFLMTFWQDDPKGRFDKWYQEYKSGVKDKNSHAELYDRDGWRSVAYHLDANLANSVVKDYCKDVNHIIDTLDELPEGYDLYVDASGFARKFTTDKTEVIWDHHLVNSAWVCPFQLEGEINPYTQTIARECGWQFIIDLQNRTGSGYVYSDKYISDVQALEHFKGWTEGRKNYNNIVPRLIKWRPNVLKNSWKDNVVTIGLGQGFVDPLEANGLYMVVYSITLLVKCILKGSKPEAYNKAMLKVQKQNSDYLLHHYMLSDRKDTPFWEYYSKFDMDESLWKNYKKYPNKYNNLYPDALWAQLGIYFEKFKHYTP